MRPLTDAHAHLADTAFDHDRAEVLQRAAAAGVGRVVVVGEHEGDADRVLALAAAGRSAGRPVRLAAAIGLHPEHADASAAERMIARIRLHRDELVAIGEVGLDYWKAQDDEGRALQRRLLAGFALLSRELDLPLNVHSRSAGHHTIGLLREHGATRVLMHAFDGRASRALAGVEAGYLFSVPPSVVRSPQKQKLVRRLPLSCLLLETDSPVLAPERGERNEPANAVVSLRAVAELKRVPAEEVAEVTSANARRLFRFGD